MPSIVAYIDVISCILQLTYALVTSVCNSFTVSEFDIYRTDLCWEKRKSYMITKIPIYDFSVPSYTERPRLVEKNVREKLY